MRTNVLPILVVYLGTLGAQCVHGEDPTDAFVGTWVLETLQNGNEVPKDFTKTREPRQVLMITGPHIVYGKLDPASNKFLQVNHGGKLIYVEETNSFQEHVECGNQSFNGRAFPFTLRLENNDRLIKERILLLDSKSKVPQRQVLTRFNPVLANAQENGSTLGDKLIGLKKAYDAGALTEREYQQQKVKLLNQK